MTPPRARGAWAPYPAGVALGLVVLASYLIMGFGPGASGAFTHAAAHLERAVAPGRAAASEYFAGYLSGGSLGSQWIVVQMVGVVLGAVLSAWTGGRLGWRIERGPRVGMGRRLLLALAGGAVVGFASRIAQGCTSGLALSGGAVLAPGAWAFLAAFMAGGFAAAWLVRRTWQ